jgi:hypothetical protein
MSSSPEQLVRWLREHDPDSLDSDDLDAFDRHVAELRAWCDARQVRATRRRRRLAAEGRSSDPHASLTNHGRQSSKDAKAADEREQVCTSMPGFEDALTDGRVSAGHVDAIAGATRGLDDAERAEFMGEAESLLDQAREQGVDRFGKECRDLAKSIRARHNANAENDELERQRAQSKVTRWVDKQTGMHKTLIEADPETDRRIWAAFQAARGKLRRRNQQTGAASRSSWDRLTVDAVVEAVTHPDAGNGGVVVHIDADSLIGGRHDRTLCETDSGVELPIEVVRRMACEADLIPVVLDGKGVVLDEGRAKRLATREQRMAIQAMQSTCSYPDCRVSIDECRIHHLDPWARGGRTDIDRMAPACETHHHLVHEGGWRLEMTPDRMATWIRPDGVIAWRGSLLDRRAA